MVNTENVKRRINQLEEKYNGDNDTIPGAPYMTHMDFMLLDTMKYMVEVIDNLHQRIVEMEEK